MTFKLSKVCASRLRERVDFEVLDTYADETISTLHEQLEKEAGEIESATIRGALQACRQLKRLKEQAESILQKP